MVIKNVCQEDVAEYACVALNVQTKTKLESSCNTIYEDLPMIKKNSIVRYKTYGLIDITHKYNHNSCRISEI